MWNIHSWKLQAASMVDQEQSGGYNLPRKHFELSCLETLEVVKWLSFVYRINNVGRMLLLGLPRKQNGHTTGYIMLLLLISPLKRRVQHL